MCMKKNSCHKINYFLGETIKKDTHKLPYLKLGRIVLKEYLELYL